MSKILVVEDDQTLREVYCAILKSADYIIQSAQDGLVALQKCSEEAYDVILLDLMMPELDGLGFLQAAKLAEVAPSTKVIVFSNLSSGKEIEKSLELGAIKHVLKSTLTPRGLLDLIQSVLE